jgi:predicted phosphate transport protein (TIGR00153 family)
MVLRLFRSLLPRDDQFIAGFCEHSQYIVRGAEAFRSFLSGDGQMEMYYAEIARSEEAADEITRRTIQAIHRTFITPFDRSQILDLITGLDDILDLIKDAARRIQRYRVPFTPEMQGMADCAVRAAAEIRDVMPALGAISRHAARLEAMQHAVSRIESEADEMLDRGLRILFESNASPGYKLTVEKVYDLIEAVVDRCEDVADVIEGIVIEQV